MKHIRWKNLEKDTFRYALIKFVSHIWHNHVYYRHVITLNADRIPKNCPVIIAPNHQNAAMDGLAIASIYPGQMVFMARSDIFKKRMIASFLTLIKIMPIYRIRDGISNLQNNDIVFRKTVDILRKNRPLVILPEGNHSAFKRLRMLRKGISRIAFQAEEASNFQLGLKILPVGLDYKDIRKFKSALLINFGDPINVSDFFQTYRENNQKGMNALREELARRLRSLIVHIESEKHYHTYINLLNLYFHKMRKRLGLRARGHAAKYFSDQKLVEVLDRFISEKPREFAEIEEKVDNYESLREKMGLRNWLFEKGRFPMAGMFLHGLILAAGFPVFLYGTVVNALPYFLPIRIASGLKDQVFASSIKYVMSLFLFPVFYLIAYIVMLLISGNPVLSLLLLLTFPVSGIIGFRYYISWKKFMGKYRFIINKRMQTDAFRKALSIREELIGKMDQIVNGHGQGVLAMQPGDDMSGLSYQES